MKLNIQLFAVSKKTTFSEKTHEDSNTSDLTINIEFSANNSKTYFSSKTLSCTCNGSTVSKKVSLSKGGKVSTSFEFKGIIHNLDGSKSVNWNWSIATGTSVLGTLTDSGTFDLTHYQRNSTFDKSNWSTAEIPVETPKTVTIKQNRSDVYHKLLYRFIDKNENVWKTFATRNNPTLTNSQYTINYSAEELSEFYSNCSSKWSSLISIELYTYTDANLTKQLGETDTVWYVGTIVNATPEIKNCSVEDSLNLTSITGSTSRLIRHVSKPKLSWEKDIKKGATLVSQLLNGANAVSPVIKDWSDTYLLQIIDSRGQNTNHVFNLDPAQNENVVPYIPLTLVLDADRPLPTTGEIKLDVKGSFYPGKFKTDGPNNTITVNYCIREQGTTNWETGTIDCSVENNSYTGSITLSNRDYQKNFEVYAYVSDMIGTTYNGTADNPKIVSKGEPVLALSDELAEIFGKLIVNGQLDVKNTLNMFNCNKIFWKEPGFGDKFCLEPYFSGSDDDNYFALMASVGEAGTDPDLEGLATITAKSGHLWLKGDANLGGYAKVNGEILPSYEGWCQDANNALREGRYWCGNFTTNLPGNTPWGYLRVRVSNGSVVNHTDNWGWQEYFSTSGRKWIRYIVNTGSWSAWKEINTQTTLYDNTSGTNANLTLNASAANYDYIEIYFRDNNNNCSSVKVCNPNGKSVSLISHHNNGNNTIWFKTAIITISGNSITFGNSEEVRLIHGSSPSISSSSNIYITRVVGY